MTYTAAQDSISEQFPWDSHDNNSGDTMQVHRLASR